MRQIAPIVGGVIGFMLGGPAGAALGMSIGGVVGNAVDPLHITTEGPELGDLRQQTSGGKGGGGKQTTITHHVKRTYAVGICRGPIDGVIRVWRNGKLVYDLYQGQAAGPDANDYGAGTGQFNFEDYVDDARAHQDASAQQVNNAAFLKLARFHLGTYDQMPDPHIETYLGAGNVPPHRGLAYMVVHGEELTQLAGAVPNYHFQVYRELDGYTTSAIYGLVAPEERAKAGLSMGSMLLKQIIQELQVPEDEAQAALTMGALNLRDIVITLDGVLDESEAVLTMGVLDLKSVVIFADGLLDEAEAQLSMGVLDLQQVVLPYNHHADDDDALATLSMGVLNLY